METFYDCSPEEIFDALFDRVANGKTADILFGNLANDRRILHEKRWGRAFTLLYLEIPLCGQPAFDLHVIYDTGDQSWQKPTGKNVRKSGVSPREDVFRVAAACACTEPSPSAGKREIVEFLDRYAQSDIGGDGVDVAYDLRESVDAPPMVYLKMSDNTPNFDAFFAETGDAEGAERFARVRAKLPEGWNAWYTGVHTGRKGKPLRIGSFIDENLKKRYARDIRLFSKALQEAGFDTLPLTTDKLKELFSYPLPVDVQLDVLENGQIGDVLGISLTTRDIGREALAVSFANGYMKELMTLLSGWGASDERWKLLPEATFSVLRVKKYPDGKTKRFVLSGKLNFVKVRFQGASCDAKAYFSLAALPI